MGCPFCKTATVIPLVIPRTEERLLENIECTEQQNTIIQDTPLQLVQPTIIDKVSSSKSNEFIEQVQSTKKSTSHDSARVTMFNSPVPRATTAKTTTLNEHQRLISDTTSSASNKRNTNDELDARITSTDSIEVIRRQKTPRIMDVESVISDFLEDNISNATFNELDGSNFCYDDIVSSSASTNTEKRMLFQNNILRFTSANPQNYIAHQETIINDYFSDSDESYPLRDSIVTSTSFDSEESTEQQEASFQSRLTDTQRSNVQQNIVAHETSNVLDKTNLYLETISSSISSDAEDISVEEKTVIIFKSLHLNKSDTLPKPIVYETSSDPNEL